MPFLTILTRAIRNGESYARSALVQRCYRSVEDQTDRDLEWVMVINDGSGGVEASYTQLRDVQVHGDYVYILDDDDYLSNPNFVKQLKEAEPADFYIVKIHFDVQKRDLPDAAHWQQPPALGHISIENLVVSRAIWEKERYALKPAYEADYYFIKWLFDCGYTCKWLDIYASTVDRISNGASDVNSAAQPQPAPSA